MMHSERGEWDGSKVKFATIEMGNKNVQQRTVLSSMNGESDMTVSQVKMEAGQQTSKEGGGQRWTDSADSQEGSS